MGEVAEAIELLGPRRCTVLITGETGTGKEVVAKALHSASARATRPLVAVCCSAIPDQLLESELFGHVKGAFTGASSNRVGRFEEAQGGTIFLDEIGDMPPVLQSKLLRVLQEREFQKLGSSETVRVDVRILAATNAKLLEKIRRGEFREDLYYRLKVGVINVPPLRERIDDIPALATYFLARTCQLEGLPEKRLAPEMMEALLRYRWPGNVRELENAIEAAVAMSGLRRVVEPGDFRLEFVSPPATCAGS
jgi:transcriptional regulator with GAF, ATPase, and Fis domain